MLFSITASAFGERFSLGEGGTVWYS